MWRGYQSCGEVTQPSVARLLNLWRDYLWRGYLVARLQSGYRWQSNILLESATFQLHFGFSSSFSAILHLNCIGQGRTIWYLGGGGGRRLKLKKIACRHKSQKKKVCWKCEQKKKVCCRNWWKICWPEKHQKVTYKIGKAYDKKIIRHNCEHKKKNCRTLIAKKKNCFTLEVKKKFASNKNSSPPPPQISNGASLSI